MAGNTFEGDVRVTGGRFIGDPNQANPFSDIPRVCLQQDNLKVYPLPLADFFVWDSGQPLPATPASDDLGIAVGTFGTNTPAISAGDLKAAGATTRYARYELSLPPEYVAGETVNLRIHAGMLTTVADTSCTVDVEAFKSNRESLVSGSDLVTTAATSINSTTFADKDFTLTSTALNPGDKIDIRIKIVCTDAATVTVVKPTIGSIELLADIKG